MKISNLLPLVLFRATYWPEISFTRVSFVLIPILLSFKSIFFLVRPFAFLILIARFKIFIFRGTKRLERSFCAFLSLSEQI